MSYNCQIIKDLLPLYADDLLSQETTNMLNQHLAICEDCQKEYQLMKSDIKAPVVSTGAKNDAKILKRIKLTFDLILYPLLLGLMMASSAILLPLHIGDSLPGIKALPLLACGFIAYLLIKKLIPSMLLTFAAAIIVPQISSDATPFATKIIFLIACVFYVFCGYAMAWLIGNYSSQRRNKSTKFLASKISKTVCFVMTVAAVVVTSMTTPYYSNMWEYAWTKALFEGYVKSDMYFHAKGEDTTGYKLSSFYYAPHLYQYLGSMSDTHGEEYLLMSGNEGIGIRVESEFEYLNLLGSNNISEQQVLMDIMISHNFRLKSVNHIFISAHNDNGIYLMNPDDDFSPISPVFKYSIFSPHDNYTEIELQIGLDAYGEEIHGKEDFAKIANEAIQIIKPLSLHYDSLVFVYKNYRLAFSKGEAETVTPQELSNLVETY